MKCITHHADTTHDKFVKFNNNIILIFRSKCFELDFYNLVEIF